MQNNIGNDVYRLPYLCWSMIRREGDVLRYSVLTALEIEEIWLGGTFPTAPAFWRLLSAVVSCFVPEDSHGDRLAKAFGGGRQRMHYAGITIHLVSSG